MSVDAEKSPADRSDSEVALAKAILSLADTAGMPDTYWQTDSRTTLAREVLGVPEDGRYSHAHIWTKERE